MMPSAKEIARREAWAKAHNPRLQRKQAKIRRRIAQVKEERKDPTYGEAIREREARYQRERYARKQYTPTTA